LSITAESTSAQLDQSYIGRSIKRRAILRYETDHPKVTTRLKSHRFLTDVEQNFERNLKQQLNQYVKNFTNTLKRFKNV